MRPQVACGFGSCFVPSFGFAGDSVRYAGPAAGSIQFADCCLSGDKYKVIAKGPAGSQVTVFTSSGSLNSDCSVGPYGNQSSSELAVGVTRIKYVAIALPGGTPAGAYIRMSAGGWTQTAGVDACGF